MKKVYLVKAKRTPIASFLGSLKTVSAVNLASAVIKDIIEECKINPSDIDEVITGNVLSAGLGQCVSRQASILSGISEEVTAYSINMVCGSGMKAVMNGANAIKEGADLVIAGGVESMSNSPFILPPSFRNGVKLGDTTIKDSMVFDGLTDAFSGVHMGITAENIATKYNISRERQDEFAYNSQQKAIKAVDEGRFNDEITSINVKEGKNEFVFSQDEYPNRTTSMEKLAKLRTAFKKDGTVTAGNASGLNDGSAYVLLASESAIKKYNLQPIAEIICYAQAGLDPQYMGLGPVKAIKKALENANLSLKDMDILELNEAFASQSLGVMDLLCSEHNIDFKELSLRTNVNGGAIALGHPIGASGCRILVSLAHELSKRKLNYGLASLCIGGGMGTSIIIKRI